MQTLIANLKHAAFNRESATIGGGEFSPKDLKEAARRLELHDDLIRIARQAVAIAQRGYPVDPAALSSLRAGADAVLLRATET